MRIWKEGGMKIFIKDENEIKAMQESGKILGEILHTLEKMIAPGTSCLELDNKAESMMKEYNVLPSFKGYQGFPKSTCICVNEQVVHGIPSDYRLKDGDIVSVDCGVILNGFHSDSAITVAIGNIREEKKKFINTAEKALKKAIEIARPGIRVNTISEIIQNTVEKEGYSIIKELTGHGIGQNLHEDPVVPNFKDIDPGPILQPGMTIAIEPIISMGKPEIKLLRDGWTYVTRDNSPAVQVEHTIAITEKGCIILTRRPN